MVIHKHSEQGILPDGLRGLLEGEAGFGGDGKEHGAGPVPELGAYAGKQQHGTPPFSNTVQVADGGGVEETHLRELGDVGNPDAHVDGFRFAPLQGEGQVEADPVLLVHVDHHAVGIVGAGGLAPLAGQDMEGLPLAGDDVVFQQVGQDAALGVVGDLPAHQLAVLLHGDQDLVGQGVGGAVVLFPHGGEGLVDVVQDLVRGLVPPEGGGAGGIQGGGGPGDCGIVAKAGGGGLFEAHVHIPVQHLVQVQADALVQEGFRVPAHLQHLHALHVAESLIRGSDTTIKMHPLEGARGCRGGAYLLQSAVLLSVKLLSSFQQQF